MEIELSKGDADTGWVRVKESHYHYTISKNVATLHSPDESSAISVGRAARALRKARPGLRVLVRLVPSVSSVLQEELDWSDLLERFNDALRQSLWHLGVHPRAIDELETGGMPSEYRGFLEQVGIFAQGYLSASLIFPTPRSEWFDELEQPRVDREHLANELVFTSGGILDA